MDELYWVLLITFILFLLQAMWTFIWGLFPPLVTLVISYWVSKLAARPLLKEARKIRIYVGKALKVLPADFIESLTRKANGFKGGSVKEDPLGDWLSEKTGGISDIFKKKRPSGDNNNKLEQIIKEESEKAGINIKWPSKEKDVPPGSVPLPTIK